MQIIVNILEFDYLDLVDSTEPYELAILLDLYEKKFFSNYIGKKRARKLFYENQGQYVESRFRFYCDLSKLIIEELKRDINSVIVFENLEIRVFKY